MTLPDGALWIPVGDPRRPASRRAVVMTAVVAIGFMAFAIGVKDIKALSAVAPWGEDPFDAFFSFAPFFIAIVAVLSAVRLALCRQVEALPLSRVVGLLRGCLVIAATIGLTVTAGWIAVLVAPGSPSPTRAMLTIVLFIETAAVAAAMLSVVVAYRGFSSSFRPGPFDPDWLDDAGALANRLLVGRAPNPSRIEHRIVPVLERGAAFTRRQPFAAATTISIAFGAF